MMTPAAHIHFKMSALIQFEMLNLKGVLDTLVDCICVRTMNCDLKTATHSCCAYRDTHSVSLTIEATDSDDDDVFIFPCKLLAENRSK